MKRNREGGEVGKQREAGKRGKGSGTNTPFRTKLSEDELMAWTEALKNFDAALMLSEELMLRVSQPWEAAVVRYRIKSLRNDARQILTVSLEVLCSNLHEAECIIPLHLYQLLQNVDAYLGEEAYDYKSHPWKILEDQVTT